MTLATKDIADYYNQTQNHYQKHWKLHTSHALHYGLWHEDTKNLSEALENTNRKIAELGNIQKEAIILDAGCGVGGTAIYLASKFGCEVTGITLSEKQISEGKKQINLRKLNHLVSLELMDYEHTSFESDSFDLIYGIESICHSTDKSNFLNEAKRILKPGGKLIIIDFFQEKTILSTQEETIMNRWLNRWAVDRLAISQSLSENAGNIGFKLNSTENLTKQITPSAKKLYRASLLGWIPSKLYALYNKNVTRFAKSHYQSGIYQYKALKKGLWNYSALCLEKL